MSQTTLRDLVLAKVEELGDKDAAAFFGVSDLTISNWRSGKTGPSLNAAEILMAGRLDGESTKADDEPIWAGKDVLLLKPTYRTINPKTDFTIGACYAKYGPEKIGVIPQNGTLIHESRNILIDKAMATTANNFIFTDDDMVAPCGSTSIFNGTFNAGVPNSYAAMNAITRIMSHPPEYEIVGGLYFGRHEYGAAQCASGFNNATTNEELRTFRRKGLMQDQWVGTGFMRIRRSAIEKFKKAIDEGVFPGLQPHGPKGWYGYFTPLEANVGEDISFCTRMAKIGVKTWVDTELILLHAGECLFGPRNTRAKPSQ